MVDFAAQETVDHATCTYRIGVMLMKNMLEDSELLPNRFSKTHC